MTHAPQRSFLGCNSFFLSLDAGLFVVLSFTQLGEYARLFAQFFETANGTLDGFVFSDSNSSHKSHHPQSSRTPFEVANFSSFGCQVKYFTVKMRGWRAKDANVSSEIPARVNLHSALTSSFTSCKVEEIFWRSAIGEKAQELLLRLRDAHQHVTNFSCDTHSPIRSLFVQKFWVAKLFRIIGNNTLDS